MSNNCFHCNEVIPKGIALFVTINKQDKPMCCYGCQAVSQTIVDNNLTDYYKYRTEPANKSSDLLPEQLQQNTLLDDEALQSEFTHTIGEHKETIVTVDGISCAACAWLIEKQINQLTGIVNINVNATNQRATIKWHKQQISLSEILNHIEKIGYHALPFKANDAEQQHIGQSKQFIRRLGISGILMMQVMMIAVGLYYGAFSGMDAHNAIYLRWTSMLLSLPIILYGAYPFYQGALKALKAKRLSMDVPVSIAIILAFSASCWATIHQTGEVYFESVSMFTFLLLIGKFLEFRARSRAAQVSANLLKLMPMTATKLVNNQPVLIAARKLQINDIVIIKPGETVPADGTIISGKSQINEAMLTGENLPITKSIGDNVFAGTINGDSNIEVEINKQISDTFLSQLIRLSEQSQNYKPRLAVLSDKIAQYFVALILTCAVGAAIYWYQVDPNEAFWITLSILVATCPCALSLATPTALTCATTRLNKAGILVKSAHVLESLPQIDTVAFDKTGTLTDGNFSLSRLEILAENVNKEDILAIAAALESASEHPIAKAFAGYRHYDINTENIEVVSGHGIRGEINHQQYAIGKITWLLPEPLSEQYQAAQCALTQNNQLIAIFYLADQLRDDALAVVTELTKYQQLLMLSGDNQAGCQAIAKQLPIKHIYSGLTALDKMNHIRSLSNNKIAMIGDGVNDTPVFSAAHVSFAMGGGTDIAKNGADVIFLNNKLSSLTTSFTVAKKTKHIIIENYAWAFGYNAIVLPLAMSGYITPYMAVIGMSASSILVITNSLRLLKK
ncbi:MAG: heavy metal translocating P-type ATPase [Thalassotalea sp.]